MDFTLSNAGRFYSSMRNPLDGKGLRTSKTVPINALTAVGALRILIDFTLSNARRFYSSMGNPLAVKGLRILRNFCLRSPTLHRNYHTLDLTNEISFELRMET